MARVTQAHIEARRAEILQAAAELFAENGVEGTTMQEIAARAGISAGSIYHYFADKDALLESTFADEQQKTIEMFAAARSAYPSPLQALVEVGAQAAEELCTRPSVLIHLETMLAGARQPGAFAATHRAMHEDIVARIQQLLVDAQAAGEIDPKLDPRLLALLGNAVVAGIQCSFLELEPGIDPRAPIDMLAALMRSTAPARPNE